MLAGVIPDCSAALQTKGLNVDPGWRLAWVARLKWESRPPIIARTAPVLTSIKTNAPCIFANGAVETSGGSGSPVASKSLIFFWCSISARASKSTSAFSMTASDFFCSSKSRVV